MAPTELRGQLGHQRHLSTPKQVVMNPQPECLRVLRVVSLPTAKSFDSRQVSTNLHETSEAIVRELEQAEAHARVDFVRPATLVEMKSALSAASADGIPYKVVHFAGACPSVDVGGAFRFERGPLQEPGGEQVAPEVLAEILDRHNIPLFVLELHHTCDGIADAEQSHAILEPEVRRLSEGRLHRSVVTVSANLQSNFMPNVFKEFYGRLANSHTVERAFADGDGVVLSHCSSRQRNVATLHGSGSQDVLLPDRHDYDIFLSHHHADSPRVERIAEQLRDTYGLRVWLDKWVTGGGSIALQCREGVVNSRFVGIVCTQKAIDSEWVRSEQTWAMEQNRERTNLIPILIEEGLDPPGDLAGLRYIDFRDRTQDHERIEELVVHITGGPVRRRLAEAGQPGAFPTPSQRFLGRAHELFQREREFRRCRVVLLHGPPGIGKSAFAREAAHWWTRTGFFPDGACYIDLKAAGEPVTALKIAEILADYLHAKDFHDLPTEHEKLGLAHDLFEKKSVLMVWDSLEMIMPALGAPTLAEHAEINELFERLAASPHGKGRLMVICRDWSGPRSAMIRKLDGLPRRASLQLLAQALDAAGVPANHPDLEPSNRNLLCALFDDNPGMITSVGCVTGPTSADQIVAQFKEFVDHFNRRLEDAAGNDPADSTRSDLIAHYGELLRGMHQNLADDVANTWNAIDLLKDIVAKLDNDEQPAHEMLARTLDEVSNLYAFLDDEENSSDYRQRALAEWGRSIVTPEEGETLLEWDGRDSTVERLGDTSAPQGPKWKKFEKRDAACPHDVDQVVAWTESALSKDYADAVLHLLQRSAEMDSRILPMYAEAVRQLSVGRLDAAAESYAAAVAEAAAEGDGEWLAVLTIHREVVRQLRANSPTSPDDGTTADGPSPASLQPQIPKPSEPGEANANIEQMLKASRGAAVAWILGRWSEAENLASRSSVLRESLGRQPEPLDHAISAQIDRHHRRFRKAAIQEGQLLALWETVDPTDED